MSAVLDVQDLAINFYSSRKKSFCVAQDISFQINKGEVVGIVGESGCGKSVTSLAIMGLIPKTSGFVQGRILLDGDDLLRKNEKQMTDIRGNNISMIFQDPMTSLNPVFTIGNQLSEVFIRHQHMRRDEALLSSIEMLRMVGIPSPEKQIKSFPHQLSGGMRQRVMIAMALSCRPQILIADEPTTALDVTVQAQVLELMRELRSQVETGILLITHDLGVIAEMADRVIVMYAGQIVEEAPLKELFAAPRHPYTKGLLACIPRPNDDISLELPTIPGTVPSPQEFPTGCRFCERCEKSLDICKGKQPPLRHINATHACRCWLEGEE